jgi:hypothetical protein
VRALVDPDRGDHGDGDREIAGDHANAVMRPRPILEDADPQV